MLHQALRREEELAGALAGTTGPIPQSYYYDLLACRRRGQCRGGVAVAKIVIQSIGIPNLYFSHPQSGVARLARIGHAGLPVRLLGLSPRRIRTGYYK